ncbi:MAG: hypothetical protein ACTHK6_02595, partial [Solirubrobacterales bacterium]
ERTLAEDISSGDAWTILATPNPSGAKFSSLGAISCASATACSAVGSSKPQSGWAPRSLLAERYE